MSLLTVNATSPLYGLAWPGEILRGCSADGGSMQTSLDSDGYAAKFIAASSLTLLIETPTVMEGAETISFFRRDTATPIGISYEQPKTSAYPRLIEHLEMSSRFHSIASQLSGSDRMNVGDVIVGLSYGGVAHHVTGIKDLNAQLAGASGDIALRLVRAQEQENASANR